MERRGWGGVGALLARMGMPRRPLPRAEPVLTRQGAPERLIATLGLQDREVAQVMRHRRDIAAISADSDPVEVLRFCLDAPYTRIPLWRGEPENIVGVLHAKDLLRAWNRLSAEGADLSRLDVLGVARAPWFVPDTRPLDDQLRAFLKRKQHFALVVDEYGSLQGLITLEDILEEIVGDIADEHDVEAVAVTREADGAILVAGTMTIRDFNRELGHALPDDEATTLAGLVIHEAQTIPVEGQVFQFHGLRFEVVERQRQQITCLRLRDARTAEAGIFDLAARPGG